MRLLGIAGKSSRCGKSTAANFIFAHELRNLGIIQKFEMDEDGKLYVNHDGYEDEHNKIEPGMAELNMECRDAPFIEFLSQVVWPHVKIYHFADLLKFIAINMYGLSEKQVYGTTKEKESDTPYTYEQLKKIVPNTHFPKNIQDITEKVPARKFVQYLADTFRELNDNCFMDPLMKKIFEEQPPFSIIDDVRRKEEVNRIKEMGGKVIFLNRAVTKDSHRVENEFNDIKNPEEYFDIVINSQDSTIAQKNLMIETELKNIGWL